MKDEELQRLLTQLIAGWENEVVEFKNVGDSYSTSDIGKYFSALSNEANLRNQDRGWLVFGVDNRTRTVAGSNYRTEPDRLNGLKQQIASDTEPGVTFRDIHVLETQPGRVILFEIPAAPLGIPISWKGHYYARAGESLTSLGLDKLDEIRGQTRDADWSARRIMEARLDHLDPEALRHARSRFALKHANRFPAKDIALWSDAVFLDRSRLTIEGQVTATTLLLLGKPEDYLTGQRTPRRYRNPFLAHAMVALNLIDTLGYGIHRMMERQRQRFFPLPDYDLSQPGAVRMTLPGTILDAAYSRLLIQKAELPLEDVVALDRVQKRLPLDDKTTRHLKRAGLIEGRRPNFHVSAAIASAANAKAAYLKTRGLDDGYYRKLITEYLEKFGHASRADIDGLLRSKLSDGLGQKQKATKIGNLLTSMRKAGIIRNAGPRGLPCWQLVDRTEKV